MSILPELERELLAAFDRAQSQPAGGPLGARTGRRRGLRWASPSMWLGRAGLVASILVAIAVGGVALVSFHHAASTAHGSNPSSGGSGSGATGLSPAAASVSQLKRGKWSALPPAPIAARTNASVVWTGHEMIVWAGAAGERASLPRDGAAYVPATGRWHLIPPAPISGRQYATAVWDGHEMIVWGGYDRGGTSSAASATGAAYDPTTNRWRRLPAAPLTARARAFGVWTGHVVIVFGGQPGVETRVASSDGDGAAYDPSTNRWTQIAAPRAVRGHGLDWATVAQGDGQLFAWSDWYKTWHLTRHVTTGRGGVDLFVLNERTLTWKRLPTNGDAVGSPDTALWTGRRLLIRGAPSYCPVCLGPTSPDLSAAFDPTTRRWNSLPADPLDSNGELSAWTGNALFSWNDGDDTAFERTVTRGATAYNPASGRWTWLPRAPFVCQTTQAPLWTGRQLLAYCPVYGRHSTASRYGGIAFSVPSSHRRSSSKTAPVSSSAKRAPRGTFISLVPACACGNHTELDEFSLADGRLLRRIAPIAVGSKGGQALDTPAATADGALLLTYTHGARCKPGTSTMDGCDAKPDTCGNTVERLLPGQKRPSTLFTVPGDVAIGEAVPNPAGSEVAFTETPCTGRHGVTGLFVRELRTGRTQPLYLTANRCDGFTAPAWNAAGTSLAVGFFRARGGPSNSLGGVTCPAAGHDDLLIVSAAPTMAVASTPMTPGRGCQFYAVAFDDLGPVAADGCSRGSPHGFSSSNLGYAYLVQYDSAARRITERLPLQRGMEEAVVDTIPGTGRVLVTQDQPANNGTPEDDWVWSFDGHHLRAIAHYRADDAADVLAVPW